MGKKKNPPPQPQIGINEWITGVPYDQGPRRGVSGWIDIDKSGYDAGAGAGARQQETGVGMLGASAYQGADFARQGKESYDIGENAFYGSLNKADFARGRQSGSLGLLESAARGEAPSQAQLMLKAQADQNLRQQQAAAAAVRGGGQAAALRNASMMGTQGVLQAAQQSAALRAQEMAQAREGYATAITDQRQQDINTANQAAAMSKVAADMRSQGIGYQTDAAGKIGILGGQREDLYSNMAHDARIAELNSKVGIATTVLGGGYSTQAAQIEADAARRAAQEQANAQIISAVFNTGGQIASTAFGLGRQRDPAQTRATIDSGLGAYTTRDRTPSQAELYGQDMGISPDAAQPGMDLLYASGVPLPQAERQAQISARQDAEVADRRSILDMADVADNAQEYGRYERKQRRGLFG